MNRHASMNRIYRLVWNRVRSVWIPVAENARGPGKAGRSRLAVVEAAALTVILMPLTEAAPTSGKIVSGAARIAQSGATTTIQQTSQDVSINWQSFNIEPKETVDFLQPSASAIAVNRIVGSNGSQILGHLDANGQVYLINPNGIIFGKGAEVNVSGLVASTLDLDDANFVGSTRSFSGGAIASVINQGAITAADGGYVALLGAHVINGGVVTARLGTVALGAGSALTLTFSGNSLVHLQVDRSVLNNIAENGGLLQANGGQVVMTAGAKDALLASVVNNTGVIEARTVENHDGTITLLGGMAAGIAHVGGTLDASAPQGGSGGRIETSAAHVEVADRAKVTTEASSGLYGSWLVDPQDFTVAASGGDITGTTLSAELATTAVTLQSSHGGKSGAGNVNVDAAVSWNTNSALTLTASNDVNVNAVVTATGASAGIIINPNTATGAETASGAGTFNLGAGAAINLPNVSPSAASALVIGGTSYTVLNRLGAAGSTSGTDLQGMNGRLAGNYALGSNIDASSTATWNSNGGAPPVFAGFQPIGSSAVEFTGTLDGLGHTISNLYIHRPNQDEVGLIGSTGPGAVVRNVGITGARIVGESQVGGLVGFNDNGNIINSSVSGSVKGSGGAVGGLVGSSLGYTPLEGQIIGSHALGSVIGGNDVGGLVGYSNGTVSNSYAKAIVQGTQYVGGLVGYGYGDYMAASAITNSHATGRVTGSSYVGGLVGANGGTYGSVVSNSYATGNVSGTSRVGGLAGFNGGNGNSQYGSVAAITNSYATGTVTGTGASSSGVGGLVGYNDGLIASGHATGAVVGVSNVGGLVGYSGGFNGNFRSNQIPGTVENSYATGSVSGTSNVGGLVGYNSAVSGDYGNAVPINDSYASGRVSGSTAVGGLVGNNAVSATSISNSYATGATSGSSDVGGLVGLNGSGPSGNYGPGTVTDSYSVGKVSGTTHVGGLVGFDTAGAMVTDSYWNVTTSGQAGSAAGTPLTTSQMLKAASFSGFNFTSSAGANGNNWVIVDSDGTLNNAGGAAGATFPMLASEYSTTIGNAHQLQLAVMDPTAAYTLAGNIDASATTSGADVWGSGGFVPIGNSTTAFTGTLAGFAHTIGNLNIVRPTQNDIGLFGVVGANAEIRNVGLVGGSVSGGSYVGGLVGSSSGSIISNSYNTGSVKGSGNSVGGLVGDLFSDFASNVISGSHASGSVSGVNNVGGLVGHGNGEVRASYATGAVHGASYVGGLVGFLYGNYQGIGSVDTSYATGHVSGTRNVGGLAGGNGGEYGSVISTSHASGAVNGTTSVGGLVGYNGGGNGFTYGGTVASIIGSSATGTVAGTGTSSGVGGLVGLNGGTIIGGAASGAVTGTANVGGLVGYNGGWAGNYRTAGTIGTVENSYATGRVSGASNVGGLVGFNSGSLGAYGIVGTIKDSYATGPVNGTTAVGGLVGNNAVAATSISDSYALGATSGSSDVGGLVGLNGSGQSGNYGAGTVTDSYSAGRVSGTTSVGGLIGANESGAIVSHSYWDVARSGHTSSAAGAPLSAAQMLDAASFAGFHFTSTPGAAGNNWVIIDANGTLNNAGGAAGGTLPVLASEYSTTVSNTHQLQLIDMNTAAHYTLNADIDASATGNGSDVWGGAGFIPIGRVSKAFSGIFDGQSHTVSNLTVDQPTAIDVGLFGHIGGSAVVKNVGLVNSTVNGSRYVGALVGFNDDTAVIDNSYATGQVTGSSEVGGLVGENEATVFNSYAGVGVRGVNDVGGLVGWNSGGKVTDTYATGQVIGTSGVGGLVGYENKGGMVKGSFWDKSTSGQTKSAGGIGLTTAQLQTEANLVTATAANGGVNPDWDFSSVWFIAPHAYPLLISFENP